ncbi:GTP cyclohydrolase I [Lactococcus fujiensis]|nr:GTP cyclohydrolase I [Lactococcus fujiensis]
MKKKINQAITGIEALIDLIGEDVNREGLQDTPYRFFKGLCRILSGL